MQLLLWFHWKGSFSTRAYLYYDQTTESDVVQCNFRFWENIESNVSGKVWKAISDLGIFSSGAGKDYKKKIKDMEKSDKEKKTGFKGVN